MAELNIPITLSGFATDADLDDVQAQIDALSTNTGKTLWVDAVFGDDGTGEREKQNKPFLTLAAAVAAAQAGDTIHVRPGAYVVTNTIAKNGVNWYGEPGASITKTDGISTGIFDDDGVARSFTVGGYFDLLGFESGATWTRTYGLVAARHVDSDIRVFCRSMYAESTDTENPGLTACSWGFDGRLSVQCERMNGVYSNCLYWENGEMFTQCPSMDSVAIEAIATIVDAVPTGKMWVNGQEITSSGQSVISLAGTNADAQAWIQALEIRGTAANTVGVASAWAAKTYVNTQKLTGGVSGPALQLTGGQSWIVAEKLSGGATGPDNGLVNVDAGTHFVNTQQMEPLTADRLAVVTGGTLTWTGGTGSIDGDGFDVRGGTTRLNGVFIDTSSSNSSNPVVISGGVLILKSCTLVAESTQDSIEAASPQTVISYGSYASTIPDANVTVNGDLTVASYVQ